MKKRAGPKDKIVMAFVKKARVIVNSIGEKRDELRDLIIQYEDIFDSVDRGYDNLTEALDLLSETL